eukprot:14934477-Ditylum_brightwellii.AAC.1
MGSKKAVKSVLKRHTNTVAWMSSVSKVKGHTTMHTHDYIQRIAFPWKVKFQWAKKNNSDEIFHGKQFMCYPDGTIFLHVEMLVNTQDNYCPEECLLETAAMSPQGQVMRDDATVSPAILGYSSEDNSQHRSTKCPCHHDDEGSVASGNRSVSAMSTDVSAGYLPHLSAPTNSTRPM